MNLLKDNKTIIIISSILIALGTFASVHENNTILIIALCLSALFALYVPVEETLLFVVMLIAPNRVLTYGPISAPTIVILVCCFKMYIQGILNVSNRFRIVSFVYILIALLSVLFVNANIPSVIKVLIVLVFISNSFVLTNAYERFFEIVSMFALGAILTSLIAVFINPISLVESSRFSITESGQNVLGIICAVNVIFLSRKILFDNTNSIANISLIIILLCIGFFTGSRSFLLSLSVGVGCLFLGQFSIDRLNTLVKILFILLFFYILFLFLVDISPLFSSFLENFIYRANKLEDTDVSNGRFDLWEQYLNVLLNHDNHFLFGGIKPEDYNIELVAHNMIIEQLSDIGVVGSIFVTILYYFTFKQIKEDLSLRICIDLSNAAPMLGFLSACFVSHTMLGLPQTVLFFLCCLCILNYND